MAYLSYEKFRYTFISSVLWDDCVEAKITNTIDSLLSLLHEKLELHLRPFIHLPQSLQKQISWFFKLNRENYGLNPQCSFRVVPHIHSACCLCIHYFIYIHIYIYIIHIIYGTWVGQDSHVKCSISGAIYNETRKIILIIYTMKEICLGSNCFGARALYIYVWVLFSLIVAFTFCYWSDEVPEHRNSCHLNKFLSLYI